MTGAACALGTVLVLMIGGRVTGTDSVEGPEAGLVPAHSPAPSESMSEPEISPSFGSRNGSLKAAGSVEVEMEGFGAVPDFGSVPFDELTAAFNEAYGDLPPFLVRAHQKRALDKWDDALKVFARTQEEAGFYFELPVGTDFPREYRPASRLAGRSVFGIGLPYEGPLGELYIHHVFVDPADLQTEAFRRLEVESGYLCVLAKKKGLSPNMNQ